MNGTKTVFAAYQRFLNRYPIGSQAIQTGILMATGDLIAQTIVEKKPLRDIDQKRFITFAGIGLCLVGPAVRLWYGVLDRSIKSKGLEGTLKKVVLDQLVFAPSFLIVVLTCLGLSRHMTLEEIRVDIQKIYLDIMITNYQVWPMIQVVNFAYVPLQYQVVVVQSVSILWNTYLSWKARKLTPIPKSD